MILYSKSISDTDMVPTAWRDVTSSFSAHKRIHWHAIRGGEFEPRYRDGSRASFPSPNGM